jgi:hypothetical protein
MGATGFPGGQVAAMGRSYTIGNPRREDEAFPDVRRTTCRATFESWTSDPGEDIAHYDAAVGRNTAGST